MVWAPAQNKSHLHVPSVVDLFSDFVAIVSWTAAVVFVVVLAVVAWKEPWHLENP